MFLSNSFFMLIMFQPETSEEAYLPNRTNRRDMEDRCCKEGLPGLVDPGLGLDLPLPLHFRRISIVYKIVLIFLAVKATRTTRLVL